MLTTRFVVQSARHFRFAARVRSVLRTRFIELGLTAGALALLASKVAVWLQELADPATRQALDPVYRQYAAAFVIAAGLRVVVGDFNVRRVLHRLDLRPAQTVALGFAALVLAGTILLSLPFSVERLEELSLVDALFTATSAATVTGLIVHDPGTFYTAFGQGVLLLLIQLGGLGTMAASASLVVLAGRRLRLARAAELQESMDLETVGHVRSLLRTIVVMTAVAEGAGALVLWLLWRGREGIETPTFAAAFHAVSAFCNAGFSTFATSLTGFVGHVPTNAVFVVLIVAGGLGFPIMSEIWRFVFEHHHGASRPLFSLHARLGLVMTGGLLLVGTLAFLVLEWGGALASLGGATRVAGAGFLSVTARTAGFNTIATGALAPATLLLLMALMFVGGCPGSTAGGIKTTTAATVVATLWTSVRGRPRVEAFRRTIPDEQVAKALALVGISFATVAGAIVFLLATQAGDPLALTFEAVSAFGTVGLSTGVTPTLNLAGKAVIMALMFAGRTGPLTLAFALAARSRPAHVTYPSEKVMIG